MTRYAWRTPAAVVLVAVLVIAGCGGGEEGSTSTVLGGTGDDDRVQAFGAEADPAERTEAATAVRAYLSARAAGQWENACSYLTGSFRTRMAKFGERADAAREVQNLPSLDGCDDVMKALTVNIPKPALRDSAQIDEVLSLRVDGGQGFLIFVGPPDATHRSMQMDLEGGEWRVSSLTPGVLPV